MIKAGENRFRNYWDIEEIAQKELRGYKEKQVIKRTLGDANT